MPEPTENVLFNQDDDAVAALKGMLKAKAESDDDEGKDKDDDSKKEEYNEAYMKKNLSKFMKDNPDYMKGMMGKMGMMKKAVDDAFISAEDDGDLSAEVTMVDGTEMFKAFKEMGNEFIKAAQVFADRLENIERAVGYSNDVSQGIGEVLIKASETLESISSAPMPTKTRFVGDSSLQKAKSSNDTPQETMQKAARAVQTLGIAGAKKVLMKASMEGNTEASKVVTQLESCFGNMGLLPAKSIKLIADLAPQAE